MIKLRKALASEAACAYDMIEMAKGHLREQGIDQWQNGYPDHTCIEQDIHAGRGYFLVDGSDGGDERLGYLCMDYGGEPAYDRLNGTWHTTGDYVVVHRMAFSDRARGRGLAAQAFALVEADARARGVGACRVDTDADNRKMQHILAKAGYTYCGTIVFDNSEKIAFDKVL